MGRKQEVQRWLDRIEDARKARSLAFDEWEALRSNTAAERVHLADDDYRAVFSQAVAAGFSAEYLLAAQVQRQRKKLH
jgi:hypothetical protein